MAVIEGFIMGIMAVIIGQLELLAYKLRNIKSDGGLQCFDERVVNCVKHHRKIKLYVKFTVIYYSSYTAIQIVINIITLNLKYMLSQQNLSD